MDVRLLCKILGGFLIILALLLCVPMLFSLITGGAHTAAFVQSSAIAASSGLAFWMSSYKVEREVNHRTGFAVVTISWVLACLIGAFPYWFSGVFPAFVDAVFESTSGFSGTGATVLTNIEGTDRAMLLWRSMTQWLGGMGVIVFFIAILPALGIAGVQLFKAEMPGPEKDKITPRVRETARKLWLLYVAFTLALAILLRIAGMSGFDAVNHALTTLAAGGFSTHSNGLAAFDSAVIDYLVAVFMIIASINFTLHYRALALGDHAALNSTEFLWYLSILGGCSVLVIFGLWGSSYPSFGEAFRAGFFTTICMASSSGFTNYDYVSWGFFPQFLILLLMIMGGMSGSTAGGVKCVRIATAFKQIFKELRQAVHPSAVLSLKVNNQSVPPRVLSGIFAFLFLYFVSTAAIAGLLSWSGLDFTTSISGAISSLSNIGPAFGTLGPYGNYTHLTDFGKLVYSTGMLLGRLEFFTVLVLFTPEYWRK